MVKQVANKAYTSPEVNMKLFDNNDVITTSGDDNIRGIPTDWWNGVGAQGGDF